MSLVSGYNSSSDDDDELTRKTANVDRTGSKTKMVVSEKEPGKRTSTVSAKRKRVQFVELPSLLPKPNFDDLSDDSEEEQDVRAPVSTNGKISKKNTVSFLKSLPPPTSLGILKHAINVPDKVTSDSNALRRKIAPNSIKSKTSTDISAESLFGRLGPVERIATPPISSSISSSEKIKANTKVVSSAPKVSVNDSSNITPANLPQKFLPVGWKSANDPVSGDTYYYHESTGQTSWERPRPETRDVGNGGNTTQKHSKQVDESYLLSPQLRRDIGSGENIVDVNITSIHDASAWTPSGSLETATEESKLAIMTRHWDHATGESVVLDEASRSNQKRKHQLGALVLQAQDHKVKVARTMANMHHAKRETRARYGW
eukprot:g3507.t1